MKEKLESETYMSDLDFDFHVTVVICMLKNASNKKVFSFHGTF